MHSYRIITIRNAADQARFIVAHPDDSAASEQPPALAFPSRQEAEDVVAQLEELDLLDAVDASERQREPRTPPS